MSEVFEAKHVHTGRRVALKLMESTLLADNDMAERLHREGRATSSIGDPNIVDVTDFGTTEDGGVYMVMEWIEGSTLRDVLEAGPLPPTIALEIVAQVAQGLASAHLIGIVHRDVKPENIMVFEGPEKSMRVKILDFGVAKVASPGQMRITRTGSIVGTPAYISPEQARGLPVDERADIYSLGCILYELITDSQLYPDCSPMEMVLLHANEVPEIPSLRAPQNAIPAGLDETIMRCIEKDKEKRFPSMSALKDTLRNLQRHAVPSLAPDERDAANTFAFQSRDAVRLASVARAARASSHPIPPPAETYVPDEPQPNHWKATTFLLGAIAIVATVTAILLTRGNKHEEAALAQTNAQVAKAADIGVAAMAPQPGIVGDEEADPAEIVEDSTVPSNKGADEATGFRTETASGGNEGEAGDPKPEDKAGGDGDPLASAAIWRHERQHAKFKISLQVSPRPLMTREPIDLQFQLSDFTGKLSWAITERRLKAEIKFIHFVSHDTLGSLSAAIEDTGSFGVIFSVPRSGKYHLMIKFKDGSKVIGRTQMDICVGIDPGAADVESICPHLNEFTGHHSAAR